MIMSVQKMGKNVVILMLGISSLTYGKVDPDYLTRKFGPFVRHRLLGQDIVDASMKEALAKQEEANELAFKWSKLHATSYINPRRLTMCMSFWRVNAQELEQWIAERGVREVFRIENNLLAKGMFDDAQYAEWKRANQDKVRGLLAHTRTPEYVDARREQRALYKDFKEQKANAQAKASADQAAQKRQVESVRQLTGAVFA